MSGGQEVMAFEGLKKPKDDNDKVGVPISVGVRNIDQQKV
jgi:hypothetical protein